MQDEVIFTEDNGVGVITLNRPDRLNALTYTMVQKTSFRFPTERYLNVVKRGYKDCKLDQKYLEQALSNK